ncbi:netrin receptor UNC5B-b-like [Antedon mediterranea]|uniref:netrin receptor UNC5B-b-like n=1 Tax=Antedon mediterranea TaxID=105859 RepID=UPI003AF823B8
MEEDYNQTDVTPYFTPYSCANCECCLAVEGSGIVLLVSCVLIAFFLFAVLPPLIAIFHRRRKSRPHKENSESQIQDLNDLETVELNSNVLQRETGNVNEGYLYVETECEIINKDSAFRTCIEKAEVWKSALTSTNYDQNAFCLPYFRAGIFDKRGGSLTFEEAGITLLIPPGAIQQPTPQLIYIYLHNGNQNSLGITSNMMATSPVVFCGPSGMKFNERVLLSYQHCANIINNNVELITLRTETEPDQIPNFYNLSDDNDSLTLVKGNTVTLMLPHFTGHTTVVQCEQESVPIVQEKWLDLMLFSSQMQEDEYYLQVRLYCSNQTPDARYLILEDERLLNGSMCSPTTPFLFAHVSDLTVLLNPEGDWTVTGGKTKQVISRKCLIENVRVPCVYLLEYDKDKMVTSTKCRVHVTQDEREESHGKIIDVLVKTQKSAEPEKVPNTRLVRRRLLLPYPLRESIRKKLDVPNTLGKDWKHLAYSIGYDDCIHQWEDQLRKGLIFSPTNELLNIWESTRSGDEKHDLEEILEIFKNMERLDVLSDITSLNLTV